MGRAVAVTSVAVAGRVSVARGGVSVADGSDVGEEDAVSVGMRVGAGGNATVVSVAVGSGVGGVLQAVTAVTIPTNIKSQMRIRDAFARYVRRHAPRFKLSNRD